jgi:hypothetical protein
LEANSEYYNISNKKNKNSSEQWLHAMPVRIFERKMEIENPLR